jgi:hypothetical protein
MGLALEREDMDASFPQAVGAPAPIRHRGGGAAVRLRAREIATMGQAEQGRRRIRRDGAQAPRRARTPRVRRSYTLSAEADERLRTHALGLGVEPAELVERYCLTLRRFVLTDRGGGESQAGEGMGNGPAQAEAR